MVVQLSNINKKLGWKINNKIGGKQVLFNVDLNIEKGSIHGLLGPNGAGKTTLIKIMLGLLKPDSGYLNVLGESLGTQQNTILSKVSYVAEKFNLYENLTVKQLFSFQKDISFNWDDTLANDLLSTSGIKLNEYISDLSKGQQRLLQLIIAVAPKPQLMVLDEPFDGLDPVKKRWIIDTVVKQVIDTDCTICFSSHHLEHVERLCDHISVINEGKIIFDGTPSSLQEMFKKPLMDSYIKLVNQEVGRFD